MGNLFSSEYDLNDKTYSVKNLIELKNDLGRIVYKNNDEVEINFSELNVNKENFNNFSNVSNEDLVEYLKNIEENLFTNYNEESWLQKQLDNELLDNNVLKVEFNSVLPTNYENYNYLLDFINFDNDDKSDNQNEDKNNDDDNTEEGDRKIVELYEGSSVHIFKDDKLLGKPLYGKVDLENVYVGSDSSLGLYSNYTDSINLSNALQLDWYVLVLKSGEVYVIFDNYNFCGTENDNILQYNDNLLQFVLSANNSFNNNNLREFESYVTQFNKYVEKLNNDEEESDKQMIVMLGDSNEGQLLTLNKFVENLNFDM